MRLHIRRRLQGVRVRMRVAAIGLGLAILAAAGGAAAQNPAVPNYWNPGERLIKPDLSGVDRLRFLTTTDFPPFNFIDRRKRLSGFNVDLARAICTELAIMAKCEIQALPWDELPKAIERGDGEAIIAGLEMTSQTRREYEFTRPYLQVPGRFVQRRESAISEPMAFSVRNHKTGLVAGSVHAEWFQEAFRGAASQEYPDRAAALAALGAGKVDLVFSDAVSLAFWQVSEAAGDCCVFAGEAYQSPGRFGGGMSIAFAKGRTELAAASEYAIKELNDKGVFAELYLRYFPLSLY